MVDPLIIVLLFILGILFAILATMVGIGGGLLNVPFLLLLFTLTLESDRARDATLISSFVIIFTSTSGFLRYNNLKRIDFKTAGIYLLLAIPGSIVGGLVAESINDQLLKQLFAILIGISAIRGILRVYQTRNEDDQKPLSEQGIPEKDLEIIKRSSNYRRIVDKDGDLYEYVVKIGIGSVFALLGGFVAGLLGVGGGIIFVPLLVAISAVPIHLAVATSTTMIVVASIVSVVTRFSARALEGSLDLGFIFSYGIPLALGSVIGAYIGATYVKKINAKQLIALFWIVALLAAVRIWMTTI